MTEYTIYRVGRSYVQQAFHTSQIHSDSGQECLRECDVDLECDHAASAKATMAAGSFTLSRLAEYAFVQAGRL